MKSVCFASLYATQLQWISNHVASQNALIHICIAVVFKMWRPRKHADIIKRGLAAQLSEIGLAKFGLADIFKLLDKDLCIELLAAPLLLKRKLYF